jgi:hypothetical protein
MRHLKLLDCPF